MMLNARRACAATLLSCVAGWGVADADEAVAEGVRIFENTIRPILVQRCYKCHSADAKKVQGELLLDTRQGARAGGEMGPAVVPGDVDNSLLIEAIRHESLKMPPDGKLPQEVVADFVRWIEMGAPDPRDGSATTAGRTIDIEGGRRFWSFQPLRESDPPEVENEAWVRTPIDRFILARLEERGLSPTPAADQSKLIRRAYFDLTGLPPFAGEVTAFVSSESPQAYEQLVDTLLGSKHYGERWARYWLDVARFAESNGFEQDEDRNGAFHYRDFVIQSLNQDLPYDRFVQLQIAGDFFEPDTNFGRTATGFLVAGVENIIQTEKEFERDRYDKLDDMAGTVGTAMLGLTIGCARCHDHKFDPIPQRDYYRFIAAFGKTMSVERPVSDQQNAAVAYTAVDIGPQVTVSDKELFRFGTKKENFVLESNVHFLARGDVARKQDIVTQSFPQVLIRSERGEQHWQQAAANKVPPRVALANWVTDHEHGAGHLLARVIVNRLWQHHMGTGLVVTPNDFGTQGERPTHSALLDWLAGELIRGGWRLKPLHRMMMASAVYMQAYRDDPNAVRIDPQNRLLWRRSLRRLDAEAIRDAMLAVSGRLDRTQFGPGTLDANSPRRSIYLTVKRNKLNGMLQSFDAPDALQSVGNRQTTTVAPQALMLLNNPHVHQYAASFAGRLVADGDRNLDDVIRHGILTAFARLPDPDELEQMQQFIEQQMSQDNDSGDSRQARSRAIKDFCQLLLCLNEFVYVE
jgi:hypothetical protein